MRADAKRRACGEKKDERHGISQLVVQKLRQVGEGALGHPRQMSADGGLADLSTELGEFAGMRATPQSGLVKLARRIGRLLIRHTMPHEAHRLR